MKRLRITMVGLMTVIAIVGLLLAAMRHPTSLVASLAWTGVLTLLIGAALVAVLDPRRTFWVGFAVVGLIYAFFASPQFWLDEADTPLLTSHILVYLYSYFPVSEANFSPKPLIPLIPMSAFITFHRVGQALAAFIHALAGGVLAILIRRMRPVTPAPSRPGALAEPVAPTTGGKVEP